jgi:uncharacterized protein with ParB-like and HNH nuclease domain
MLNAYKKNYKRFIDRYKKVNIPNYQREYVWGENEWEDFYNDILNIIKLDFKPHFMGTLLLKEKDTYFEIIDGQQRLVTLNIFLMAYRDAYCDILEFKYTSNYLNDKIIVTDSDNVYNAIFNQTYIQSQRIINDEQSKNIEKAYQYFFKKFQVKGLFGKVTTDFNLSKIFNKLYFITIEIEDTTNPYLIFETLNARGIELNISDLVKNHLLDKSTSNDGFYDFVNSEWNHISSNMSDEQFEKAFQSYYQSSKNRKKLLKEITVNVNNEEEIREFLTNLGVYIYLYKKLDNPLSWAGDEIWQNNVRYIKSYENKHLFKVVVIAILNNFPKRGRKGAFNFIESLIFRYAIICQKDEDKLLNKLFLIAKQINEKTITLLEDLHKELHEFIIDDEEFKYSFAYRSIEHSHQKPSSMVRYILYKIENYLVRENRYTLGVSNASIEHIDSQSSSSFNVVYRLGNYTLLIKDENTKAGNKSFIDKKEGFYTTSSFEITNAADDSNLKSLKSYTTWVGENVKSRQFEMAKIAVKVWKIQ